jgi:hypothetical protein
MVIEAQFYFLDIIGLDETFHYTLRFGIVYLMLQSKRLCSLNKAYSLKHSTFLIV